GIPFDPQQARAMLAETTYGSGDGLPPLEYTTFRSIFDAVLIAILEMWQENLGVEVSINPISQGYFDFIEEQRGNIFDYGWVADYADPQNFLDVLFHSEATNNVGGYRNVGVDALLEEARTEPDPVRRLELYQQAEELLVEDVAAIPLRHDKSYIVVKPYVKGWFVSAQGNPDFLTVRLER
ncbi:MAG: ABC transporter substrate-binding protein, partial [Dehalococcoidia bacterium]